MPSVVRRINLENVSIGIVTSVYLELLHDQLQTLMSVIPTMEGVIRSALTVKGLLSVAVALDSPSLRMGELVQVKCCGAAYAGGPYIVIEGVRWGWYYSSIL